MVPRHTSTLVGMSMMYIWIVGMHMHHPFMTMRMAVWFANGRELIMIVPMMFVVNVSMIMLDTFMPVLVCMSLS